MSARSSTSTRASTTVVSTTTTVVPTTTTAPPTTTSRPTTTVPPTTTAAPATAQVATLLVAPSRNAATYRRAAFGPVWADVDHNGCDTRNDVLHRDLTNIQVRPGTHDCVVIVGTLANPYTGTTIQFAKAQAIQVQIDHVVSLGDAWKSGASDWTAALREQLANDPLNLLAVDAHDNESKGDDDASRWLPPNVAFRCTYVERQIAVKTKYQLSVTPAERDSMRAVLTTCG